MSVCARTNEREREWVKHFGVMKMVVVVVVVVVVSLPEELKEL